VFIKDGSQKIEPAAMEDLVVVAAAVEHPAPAPTGGGGEQAAAGSSGDSGWGFPLFVGHRRRLAPDDELFEAGSIEREQLAHQVRRPRTPFGAMHRAG
jgi:hypothetical protein